MTRWGMKEFPFNHHIATHYGIVNCNLQLLNNPEPSADERIGSGQ